MFTQEGQSLLGRYLGVDIRNFPEKRARKSVGTAFSKEAKHFMRANQDLSNSMATFSSHIRFSTPRKPFSSALLANAQPRGSAMGDHVSRLQDEVKKCNNERKRLVNVLDSIRDLVNPSLNK